MKSDNGSFGEIEKREFATADLLRPVQADVISAQHA